MAEKHDLPHLGIPEVYNSVVETIGEIGDGSGIFDPESAESCSEIDPSLPITPARNVSIETPDATSFESLTSDQNPQGYIEGGIIIAHFKKGLRIVEVRPPRTEREREKTEKIEDFESGIKIDFSHSKQVDGTEIIVVKKHYLGNPEKTSKKLRRQRFSAAVATFSEILGNREFDGMLHEDDVRPKKHKKHK